MLFNSKLYSVPPGLDSIAPEHSISQYVPPPASHSRALSELASSVSGLPESAAITSCLSGIDEDSLAIGNQEQTSSIVNAARTAAYIDDPFGYS